MKDIHVVTCFLVYKQQVLVLQRSGRVGSYQGRWAGVSGFIEGERSAQEQGLIEILEETGLPARSLQLTASGEILAIEDLERDTRWLVHPLKWEVKSRDGFRLDWEHTRFQWIDPDDINSLETVPGLYQAWEKVQC